MILCKFLSWIYLNIIQGKLMIIMVIWAWLTSTKYLVTCSLLVLEIKDSWAQPILITETTTSAILSNWNESKIYRKFRKSYFPSKKIEGPLHTLFKHLECERIKIRKNNKKNQSISFQLNIYKILLTIRFQGKNQPKTRK